MLLILITVTLSYHVRAKDDFKCYLLWNGHSHRFYPQDIFDILPQLFRMEREKAEQIMKSVEFNRMIKQMKPYTDRKFENFYKSLRQRIDFPTEYTLENMIASP